MEAFIVESQAMRRIWQTVEKIAQTDSQVLIQGETGTGKGLLAEIIHQKSHRASGPFVIVNCVEFPDNLICSELFGHEKGAFTGANQQSRGY